MWVVYVVGSQPLAFHCRELLYEEQPDAYKCVDIVIEDMVAMGLVDVVAVMTPLLTYKCQTPQHDGDD